MALRILLVDDDVMVRRAVAAALTRQLSAQVVQFADGPSVLRSEEPLDYAVVILDINMPAMDGIELGRRIRAKDPSLPLVYLTGNPHEITPQVAAALQPVHVLAKPTHPGEIAMTVRRLSRS